MQSESEAKREKEKKLMEKRKIFFKVKLTLREMKLLH